MRKKKKYVIIMLFLLLCLGMTAVQTNTVYAAKKVSISDKSVKLKKGVSYQLKVKNTKTTPVWKSSKKRIASVSKSGLVKAKRAGNAYIYAKVGKKTYKCKVQVYENDFPHKHKYIESVKVNSQTLILDPSIMPIYHFGLVLIGGYCYDPDDLPESIDFECGRGFGNGYFKLYDGITRTGQLIDATHFKMDNPKAKPETQFDHGDISLVTKDTRIIDLSKLDWFCIHDSVDVFYVCKYCNERRDNIGYGRGGDTYVEWDDLRDKNFKKYTHSVNGKTCTCRDFVRRQYGCWWLNVKMAPKEAEFGKYMTVTSKILREGKMEAYEFNPVKVTFSRCKHEGELVYVGSTEEYGPKNIVIDDYEHNRYQCMDCGAIMYKKDIKKKI